MYGRRRRNVIAAALVAAMLSVATGRVTAQAVAPDSSTPATPETHLLLVGVIVRDEEQAMVVIEDQRTGRQGVYRVGAIVGGGRIKQIDPPDRVIVVFGAREVEIVLAGTPAAKSAPAPSGPVVVIPGDAAPEETRGVQPADRVRTLERARLAPMLHGTELFNEVLPVASGDGLRVRDARSGGFFQTLGVRRGDVIRSVNGHIPSSGATLHTQIQQAAETGMIRLEIVRGAGDLDVTYIHVVP